MIRTSLLSKFFGPVKAVDQVDWDIPPSAICGLVGPDGAGKTTLMRMLCGLVVPDRGEIFYNGRPWDRHFTGLGYMPQHFSLYRDLTVMENIHFFGSLYNIDYATRKKRADQIMDLTGLSNFTRFPAANLSGGMKQKLALTCALITRPELLILDEPTYGVDPESRQEFWKILYQLNSEGVTILVSTPYMDEAELCHQVSFINQGKITATGSPLMLRRSFGHEVLEVRANSRDPDILNNLAGILDVSFYGSRYRLVVDDVNQAIQGIQERFNTRGVTDVSIVSVFPSMEDVFVLLAQMEVK